MYMSCQDIGTHQSTASRTAAPRGGQQPPEEGKSKAAEKCKWIGNECRQSGLRVIQSCVELLQKEGIDHRQSQSSMQCNTLCSLGSLSPVHHYQGTGKPECSCARPCQGDNTYGIAVSSEAARKGGRPKTAENCNKLTKDTDNFVSVFSRAA